MKQHPSMTIAQVPGDQTHIDMFESGWFGRGAAFWRWVVTVEAKPYVEAMASMRQQTNANELAEFSIAVDDYEDLLDPAHLAKLAQRIESGTA